MDNKLPTLEIVRQAGKQVAAFPKGIAITIAFYVLAIALLVGVVLGATGGDFSFVEQIQAGNPEGFAGAIQDGWGWIFFLSLIALMIGYAWVFNFWIRFGALGVDGAFMSPASKSLSAASVTAVKLFFITILLVIVAVVVFLVLAAVGVIDVNSQEQTLVGDLISNVVLLAIISGIYAVFSSNLTQTALGNDQEEVGPSHVFEFGVVLFSLNAIVLIPLTFLEHLTPSIVSGAYNTIGTLWLTASIPLAHGIRYDWQRQTFVGESAAEQFDVSNDKEPDEQ